MTWLFDRRREAGRSGPEGVAARPAGRRTATMAGAVRYLRGQRAGPAAAVSRTESGKMCRRRVSHPPLSDRGNGTMKSRLRITTPAMRLLDTAGRRDGPPSRHPAILNLHRKETER